MSGKPISQKSRFYSSVKTDMNLYANVHCILDKIEEDSNLNLVAEMFKQIFQKEIVFTINGHLKRTEKTAGTYSKLRHPTPTSHQHGYFQGKPETDLHVAQ